MPATAITKTAPNVAGVPEVAEVALDTVNGNSVAGFNERTVITVRNADASNPHDITFVTTATYYGSAVEDTVLTIPANTTRIFSGLDYKLYGKTLNITGDSTQIKLQALQP